MIKKLLILIAACYMAASTFAQTPEKFSYQAIVRNADNALVISGDIGMQISILQGGPDEAAVYTETHTTATNHNGLVSIEIGNGTAINGDISAIDWANGPFFIKIETDPLGGSDYTISGTNQLLSVPFALHAKTADSFSGTFNESDPLFSSSVAAGITPADTATWNMNSGGFIESDPAFSAWDKSTGINIGESQITDLAHFTNDDEADPLFTNSAASGISAANITDWNNKLDSYTETDPAFTNSAASGISAANITDWNNKLDSYTETDPAFTNSAASGISAANITDWNNKLDSYTETDPVFTNSAASGISAANIANWNNKLDSYTETDPAFSAWNKSSGISISESQITDLTHFTNADETDQVFTNSPAGAISDTDVINWNNKLDSYTETDPEFTAWDKSTGITISESQITDLSVFSYEFGDVKQGFQAADHNGWVKLDGRSIASLSPDQQTKAAALGMTSNLPDATNAYLAQNGEELGSLTGANDKAIQQNQLPNVAPSISVSSNSAGKPYGSVSIGSTTSTMNAAGNHSHSFNMVQKDDGNFSNTNGQYPTGDASKYNGSDHYVSTETAGNHTHSMNSHSHSASFSGSNMSAHSHSATASSINGGVTQVAFDVKPRTLSVNTFIYLGN